MRVGVGSRRKRPGKNFLIVILFLVCLCAAGWYLLSENIVFTADGIKITLFNKKENNKEPEDDPLPTSPPDINIEGSQDTSESESESEDEQEEPVLPMLNAYWISIGNLQNDSYVDSLITQGIKQVVFTAKDTDGVVSVPFEYSGGNPDGLINPNAEAIANNIRKLKDNDVYVIATISAMRDGIMTRANRGEVITTDSGQTWIDRDNIPWFMPTSLFAVNYTKEIAAALHNIGVDEIILTNLSYPTLGKTNLIRSDFAPSSEIITGLAQNFENSGLTFGIFISSAGENLSGQNIQGLERYFDRVLVSGIYESEEVKNVEQSLSDKEKLVCIVDTSEEITDGISCIYTR